MSTTKHIAIIASILSIALCMLGCIVSFQLFWNGCLWWECAPARSFDVLDLGLPSYLFPANAYYSPIHPHDDDNLETIRSSSQTIYWDGLSGLAGYRVDMYATTKNSSRRFEDDKASFFLNHNHSTILWSKPDELTYISPLADDFFVGCGTLIGNDYRCGVIARYQEFVVFFDATISERMTYQDFQEIVIYLDKQISSYLYEK